MDYKLSNLQHQVTVPPHKESHTLKKTIHANT